MKLKQLNSHKRDKNITFDEKPHIYYVNEIEYSTSVTKFIHEFFEKFDPQKIVDKFYDRWQCNPTSKYYGMSKDEIIKSWEDIGKTQSDLGTNLHETIELFYNDEKYNKNTTKEFSHFKNFHEDHKNLKPFRTEWMIYCEELKLAGSIDMIFEENGILHIYDWKRSKEIKEQNKFQEGKFPLTHLPDTNFWHYSLQLNCYKAILEKNYNKKVEDLYLVVLHPNNLNYIKIKVPNLQKEVKEIFEIRKNSLN